MYIILYFTLFALPAWAIPIIAASNSIQRGLVAYHHRRDGIYYPLPTYKQELHRIRAKWAAFCDSLTGLLVLILFYSALIFGPILHADSINRQ